MIYILTVCVLVMLVSAYNIGRLKSQIDLVEWLRHEAETASGEQLDFIIKFLASLK